MVIIVDIPIVHILRKYMKMRWKLPKNDKTLLVHAAVQVQKAGDFIANKKGGEEEVEHGIAA